MPIRRCQARLNRMFERAGHPNIKVMMNADYRRCRRRFHTTRVLNVRSWYLDYRYAASPTCSLESSTNDNRDHQPVAVTTTDDYRHARKRVQVPDRRNITDPIVTEFEGVGIRTTDSRSETARSIAISMLAPGPRGALCGRLATYKYYNMDQVVAQALTLYAKLTSQSRHEALAHGA